MLDFSIYSDTDRTEAVKNALKDTSVRHTQKELESMANYILFGKDENGLNAVDRKEVQIETKYGSYKRKSAESLNELMENPVFDERTVKPVARRTYTNPKPTIDTSLPELKPLFEAIDHWQHIYDACTGKIEDPNVPPHSSTDLYKIKHLLIDLKREQYVIMEAKKPTVAVYTTPDYAPDFSIDMVGEGVRPLGLKVGNIARFIDPRNDNEENNEFPLEGNGIDLENPTHIYQVLEFYSSLLEDSIDNPFKNSKYLLETIDFYIDRTPLDESRRRIVELKKMKVQNTEIKKILEKEFNLSYNENYISTIYTKEICKKIAEAVTLHKDYWLNRKNPEVWKKCKCCGQWKLRDSREFVKKKSSSDGFSTRCKLCDKKKRAEKEGNK